MLAATNNDDKLPTPRL